MQPIKLLANTLEELSNDTHYLFTANDLVSIFPDKNRTALNAIIGRAVDNGTLERVCRGLYLNPRVKYPSGMVLYHAAAKLRSNQFNYISLESALSDVGVISQIPMNWLTLMSSGRNYTFDCGKFGHIEFIHTKRTISSISDQLVYDSTYNLFRASVELALKDMSLTRRDCDLINWEVVDEYIQ